MNGILIGYDSELLDIIAPFKPHVRLTIKAENGLDFEKICGANLIGFGYQLLAVKTLQKAHMSYCVAIMSEFVDSNKLPCRVDEEVSLIQYAGTNKILREREVAMKVTCRKCGWNREGLTQGSILAVNGDD